jgi:hypothetical protein
LVLCYKLCKKKMGGKNEWWLNQSSSSQSMKTLHKNNFYLVKLQTKHGRVVVKLLCYKPEGRGFNTR